MSGVTIAVGVVGHTARRRQAEALAERVGAWLSIDDGSLGCEGNHRRVLAHLADSGADYAVVLEDDAQPVDGFADQVCAALEAAPPCEYPDGAVAAAPIVSLYLGTGYPRYWQSAYERAIWAADHIAAPWLRCSHLLHAVGYAVRRDLVADLVADLPQRAPLPIDAAITEWARSRNHDVLYTWPCLVDHADGEPVVTGRRPRRAARRAHRVGGRVSWHGREVMIAYR